MNKAPVLRLVEKNDQPDAAAVELAQSLLTAAKEGQLRGVIIATVDQAGQVQYKMAGMFADTPAVALTVVQRLKAKVEAMIYSG